MENKYLACFRKKKKKKKNMSLKDQKMIVNLIMLLGKMYRDVQKVFGD